MLAQVAQTDWMLVLTVVIAAATVAYSAVTIWMALEMRASRLAQSAPCVVAYVEHDSRRPTFLLLVVENIGKGMAFDVKFSSDRPLPQHAFGIARPDQVPHKTMVEGPLVHGIPALQPTGKRIIAWGQYGGLSTALGQKPIELTASYRSKPGAKATYQTKSLLEVESYLSTDICDEEQVLRELLGCAKRIADGMDKLHDRINPVSIEIVDAAAEFAKVRQQIEAKRARMPQAECRTDEKSL